MAAASQIRKKKMMRKKNKLLLKRIKKNLYTDKNVSIRRRCGTRNSCPCPGAVHFSDKPSMAL
jgi:hypothetical protein